MFPNWFVQRLFPHFGEKCRGGRLPARQHHPPPAQSTRKHPFSDFLLHDIGTGDGIVQVGPQDTANKLRTAPLWGLRTKARFMHDLGSLSLYNAIERHEGEAHDAARGFRDLSAAQKEELITFLRTL